MLRTIICWRTFVLAVVMALVMWIVASMVRAEDLKFHVEVNVSAPENLRSQIESYVKRELRSLGDVEIVTKPRWPGEDTAKLEDVKLMDIPLNPRFELLILAMETHSVGGQLTGVTLAMLSLRDRTNSHRRMIIEMSRDLPATNMWKLWFANSAPVSSINTSYDLDSMIMYTGGRTDLKNRCSKMITDFDAGTLEPERQRWKALEDLTNKPIKKK